MARRGRPFGGAALHFLEDGPLCAQPNHDAIHLGAHRAPGRKTVIATLMQDWRELTAASSTPQFTATPTDAALRSDSLIILLMVRFPNSKWGRRVPMSRWMVRRFLTAMYGIE